MISHTQGGSLKRNTRLMAWFVAKGFQQTTRLDYDESFSPVIKSSIVRIVLSIAVHLYWEVRQLDINNAFLNDNLKETMFIHQPEGYIASIKPDYICKLNNSIYGLKQAPRAWYDRLKDTLLKWVFKTLRVIHHYLSLKKLAISYFFSYILMT